MFVHGSLQIVKLLGQIQGGWQESAEESNASRMNVEVKAGCTTVAWGTRFVQHLGSASAGLPSPPACRPKLPAC